MITLLLLGASLLASAAPPPSGGGACQGVLECNGRLCNDCTCVNKQCKCGSGYAGPHCNVPFCNNRTDGCNGHGDCVSSLHNITCDCDYGYAGGHCETKTCTLQCQHGGTPYADCSKCDGCKGAWGGKLCDVWNGDVPQKELMAKLDQIANASQKMLDSQRQFNPICRQGHECVGWGVDGATGRPTSFPIVYLSCESLVRAVLRCASSSPLSLSLFLYLSLCLGCSDAHFPQSKFGTPHQHRRPLANGQAVQRHGRARRGNCQS